MVVTRRNNISQELNDELRESMKIIDPHLHLFNLEQGDYQWLKPNNPPFWSDKTSINKSFTEKDLTLLPPLELVGFVHIEAGYDNNHPWRELTALEQSCDKPFKAIASIDLTSSSHDFSQCLTKLLSFRSFVGVRHILDEKASTLLTNKQVLSNIEELNDYAKNVVQGLIFETQLTLTEHAPVNALCEVISANPDISFVINHAGFPPADIQTIQWQRWQSNLVKLAMYPHVTVKCSGWEMNDRNYQAAWLNENLSVLFNLFGTKRMMLASNFPLCLFSKNNYQDYWKFIITSKFFIGLSEQEKSALSYDNALHFYHLNE
jgi:predicted TIM-barrel fold metal-dependent hydrolase